jgi:hypothetical protein
MNEYNMMPKDAVKVSSYEDLQDFFTYCHTEESRQPQYDENNFMAGSFDLRVFWIDKDLNLGFGVAADWKAKETNWYRFGSDENWIKFKCGFASQFAGDNS